MTGRPIGRIAPHTPFIADAIRRDGTVPALGSSSATFPGSLSGDLRTQLGALQELVCELLFKNQQLRMALMEATGEAGSADAHLE